MMVELHVPICSGQGGGGTTSTGAGLPEGIPSSAVPARGDPVELWRAIAREAESSRNGGSRGAAGGRGATGRSRRMPGIGESGDRPGRAPGWAEGGGKRRSMLGGRSGVVSEGRADRGAVGREVGPIPSVGESGDRLKRVRHLERNRFGMAAALRRRGRRGRFGRSANSGTGQAGRPAGRRTVGRSQVSRRPGAESFRKAGATVGGPAGTSGADAVGRRSVGRAVRVWGSSEEGGQERSASGSRCGIASERGAGWTGTRRPCDRTDSGGRRIRGRIESGDRPDGSAVRRRRRAAGDASRLPGAESFRNGGRRDRAL